MGSAIVAAFHFVSIMFLMSALVAEHLLFRPDMRSKDVARLARVDLIYGLSSIAVLITGLLRMLVFEKGAAYYLHNPLFHAKLTLFVVAALISIYPTVQFLKWRKRQTVDAAADLDAQTRKRIKIAMRAQLTILVLIPFLASAIARGLGLPS